MKPIRKVLLYDYAGSHPLQLSSQPTVPLNTTRAWHWSPQPPDGTHSHWLKSLPPMLEFVSTVKRYEAGLKGAGSKSTYYSTHVQLTGFVSVSEPIASTPSFLRLSMSSLEMSLSITPILRGQASCTLVSSSAENSSGLLPL